MTAYWISFGMSDQGTTACVRGFKRIGTAGDEEADHSAAQRPERLSETIAGYLPRGDDTGGE